MVAPAELSEKSLYFVSFSCVFPPKLESVLVLMAARWTRRAAGLLSQDQAVPRFSFGARRAAVASWGDLERNGAPLSSHVRWQGGYLCGQGGENQIQSSLQQALL